MQLNIEIRESVWFLTIHVIVLGASNNDQIRTYEIYQYIKSLESQFLLFHAYIGCYTVGAFTGNPVLKILKSKEEYQRFNN